MSNTPAYDAQKIRERKEAVELCGKNRGPHDYMPIAWVRDATNERVTRLMCRTCFCHVAISNLLENSQEVSYL
jgi:hypothetical protein